MCDMYTESIIIKPQPLKKLRMVMLKRKIRVLFTFLLKLC